MNFLRFSSYEKVKDYQKTWTEPELNSVYTRRVHFSANEFKEVLDNMSKKPSERKPDNFVSKIVFMLDSMGIPLDKKKTKEQFFAFRKYHRGKLEHMFNRMKEAKEITGMNDAEFVHVSGFVSFWLKKESAIKATEFSINYKEKDN